jgi:hypothetical protein
VTQTYGFDTTPVSITSRAMSQAFNREEKERREEAQLNIDFFYGKQEQSLQLINDDVEPVILNLTKPIIHKRCTMLYGRPLQREFEGPAGSIAFLEQVYKDNAIDALLCQADLYSELTGSSLLHPFPDESLPSGLRLRLYDGTQFSTLGADNDPSTADAIDLIRVVDRLVDPQIGKTPRQMPEIERVLQHQVWTTEAVVFYEGSQLQSSEPNPYGFLPFVNFKGEEVHDQYVGWPCANLIRKLNNHVNQLLTHLGFTIKMQAGTPIVLSGFSSGESVVVHPGRALNIPAGAAADVLSLNPKIEETLSAIRFLEDRLYTSASVPKISIEGGGDEDKTHISGTQLLIRWYPLTSIFNEKAVRFTRYELQLANMILSVVGLPLIDDLKVDWPEDSVLPYNPLDEQLERDIKLNIRTPIDEIMQRDPLLTEDEAQAQLMANKTINQRNQPAPPVVTYATTGSSTAGNVTFTNGGNGGSSS